MSLNTGKPLRNQRNISGTNGFEMTLQLLKRNFYVSLTSSLHSTRLLDTGSNTLIVQT